MSQASQKSVADASDFPTGPLFQRVAKRIQSGRDAVILITADNADRGVGKTTLAVALAKLFDTSDTPFDADRQATVHPDEFVSLYGELPPGSTLLFDESGALDNRRSMSSENVDVTYALQTHRVRQVVTLFVLPSPDMIDKRVEQLADFWINAQRRGEATVYRKQIHPIERQLYYQKLQTVEWPNLDGDPEFEKVARLKNQEVINDDQSGYIDKEEAEKQKQQAAKENRLQGRNETIQAIAEQTDVTQKAIAEAVDLSHQRVNQIVNETG